MAHVINASLSCPLAIKRDFKTKSSLLQFSLRKTKNNEN